MVEGFGIALVEASACGLPVIGGRSGGIPDAVREGETGLLVDPGDPAAVGRGDPVAAALARPGRAGWAPAAAARWRPTTTGTG